MNERQKSAFSSRFPWLDEGQISRLVEVVDNMWYTDPIQKLEKQRQLYQQVLPMIQEKKHKEWRIEMQNQLFSKRENATSTQDFVNHDIVLKTSEFADLFRKSYGVPSKVSDDEVIKALTNGDPDFQNKFTRYLNGDMSVLREMGMQSEDDTQELEQEQWGLKGMLSRAGGDWGLGEWVNPIGKATEFLDDLIQKIPTVNFEGREEELRKRIDAVGEEERQAFEETFKNNRTLQALYGNVDNYIKESKKTFMDQFLGIGDEEPNVVKQILNIPWSFLKTASGISRAMTNPLDTVVGLKNLLWTEEWRQLILDRYGENFQQTLEEDPIGLASDVLSLVGMWGGIVAKGAKLAGLKNVAGNIGKFSAIADGAGNLGLGVAKAKGLGALKEAGAKWGLLAKGAVKVVEITQEPLKVAWELLKSVKDGKISEIGAELITRTVKDQDKLYKAQEPRMNVLNKKKDLKSYREQSDLANMLIVEAGHKPTDTTTRLQAHKSTMESKWTEIESKVKNKADLMVDQKPLADVLDNFIKEKEKLGIVAYQSDLKALRKEAQALRDQGLIDLPTLETKKQGINGLINNWGESKMGDVYKNGLKELTHAIGEIENKTLSSVPDEFSDLKKEFGALKATYEDVFKADMKNQRAKGIGLVESYSKIEGLTEMLWGAFSIFTRGGDGIKEALKGAGKSLLWSAYGKAKDVDFLIKKGFEGLSKEDISPLIKKHFEEARNRNQKNPPKQEGLGKLREWAETKYQLAEWYHQKSQNIRSLLDKLESLEVEDDYAKVFRSEQEIQAEIQNLEREYNRYDEENWESSDYAIGNDSFEEFQEYLKGEINNYGNLLESFKDKHNSLIAQAIGELPSNVRDLVALNKQTGGTAWERALYSYIDWDAVGFDSIMKSIEWAHKRHNATNYDHIRSEAKWLSEDAYKEYRKGFNDDVETDYTKYINSEDVYQLSKWSSKYGIADTTEKTVSWKEAVAIRNIRNGRSVAEISEAYGIKLEIVDKITTPQGVQAYGKYGDGIITLADQIKEGTAPHELFHATFDMVDHARKESILRQIEKSKGLDSLNAEEYLADSFSEYFRTGKFDTKSFGKGLVEKIKQYFYQVKQFITGANKNKVQVKKLFDEILDGEIDRNMLGEVLGNKKGTDTHRHQQSWPRLVSVPVKSSIPITPENASIFTSKLNNLSKVVKSWNFDAVDFLDGLKNNLNIDKKSWYLISQKGWLTATLRISDHYANARNNKIRWYVENNTSIVIKLWNGKFKAKNGVDLIEFVYDPKNLTPEKMQGIIKGVQDWIDTGNYTDKGYDHTHTSVRASLENGEVKYQRR